MGRGNKHQPQWPSPSSNVRVWPGAYSPQAYASRDKQPPWKAENARQGPVFPTYSSVSIPQDKAATGAQQDRAGGASARSSTTPVIQAALNQTRRAENRVARLHEAYKQSGVQWAEYEVKMKEAYKRERARFARDQEKILKEIASAEEAQDLARQGLRDAFISGQASLAATADVEMIDGPTPDQVFSGWAQEELTATDALVQRALTAPALTPQRVAHAIPRTPVMATSHAPPGLPSPGSIPTAFDPYLMMASPAGPPTGTHVHGQAPLMPAVFEEPPPTFSAGPPNAAVISTTSGTLPGTAPPDPAQEAYGKSPTLAEKVQRRRALEPFGGARASPPSIGPVDGEGALPHAGSAASAPSLSRPIRIVQDDNASEDEITRAEEDTTLS